MDILIVTPHFYPENFRINDLAVELDNRGHRICVLTAIPDYPGGKYYKGYGIFKNSRSVYKGMKIFRSPLIPRGSGSDLRLSLNYISFVVGSIFTSLFLLHKNIDIIFVFEPSPITVGIPAIFIKKIKKIPICFWVLDLWPESVISASKMKSSHIQKILLPLVKFIYRHCDLILVSSNGFIDSIVSKGIPRHKIEYFPQWAESIFKPIKNDNNIFENLPKESFKIMFAGNIGEAQDFPSILNAAEELKEHGNIHWIIIGDGRKKEWVVDEVKRRDLSRSMHFLGSHPIEKMPDYYAMADAMLLTLKKEPIFSITIPAKLQSYLACGKPILAMIDGEASKIISDAYAGVTSPAENSKVLVKNIEFISNMTHNELNQMGQNALKCYKKYFDRSMLMDKAEKIFNQLLIKNIKH